MAEALTFGNVEQDTCDYLEPLIGASAITVLPAQENLDDLFARVMLTGTRRINITLMEHRVTIECWGTSKSTAFELAQKTFGHMVAWRTDTTWVPEDDAGWTAGPYYDVDPLTGRDRYVMTANVRQGVVAL